MLSLNNISYSLFMKPNKLLVFSMLMVCQLICCLALSIIAPFFPPFAKDKGISEVIVGIIFSANPVGAIIATLILGKILTEVSIQDYNLAQ